MIFVKVDKFNDFYLGLICAIDFGLSSSYFEINEIWIGIPFFSHFLKQLQKDWVIAFKTIFLN